MGKNPWNFERLSGFLNTEEGQTVDFKSSRPLVDRAKWSSYFDQLSAHVSAFLNSDGGLLLVGLEEGSRKEQPDIATTLSPGISRRTLPASQFQSMVCDRIHPSVADLVKVYPITVSQDGTEPLLAYAVEIRSGVTAYQAADKKYYARRGYSSEPMEDKDIRLRMLTQNVPRIRLDLDLDWDRRLEEICESPKVFVASTLIPVDLEVTNIGMKSIRSMDLRIRYEASTLEFHSFLFNPFFRKLEKLPDQRKRWPESKSAEAMLHPEDVARIALPGLPVSREWDFDSPEFRITVVAYLEDAPSVSIERLFGEEVVEARDDLNAIHALTQKKAWVTIGSLPYEKWKKKTGYDEEQELNESLRSGERLRGDN